MRYVLKLKYKGTAYSGWQVQKNARTVQQTIQDAVEAVFHERLDITGCSRTDAGVHANEYYCHTSETRPFDVTRLPLALNTNLPDDIAVTEAFVPPDGFHSRYSASGKEYLYIIYNSRIKDPFCTDTALFYPKRFDVQKASEIAQGFVGKHDFTSFMSAHSDMEDTVRTVEYFRIIKDGQFIKIYIAADGFLHNMVRIMVGTLICSLEGSKGDIGQIISNCSRAAAGYTAPPHALYLNRVFYPCFGG